MTLLFWLLESVAVTLGETSGDLLGITFGLGYATTAALCLVRRFGPRTDPAQFRPRQNAQSGTRPLLRRLGGALVPLHAIRGGEQRSQGVPCNYP
ncbi:hypothetical protein ACFYM2_01850 [Streptomyces sp. NPDC006711]|uniref:hypothetical protein n=1 Tax=unclassified Streptomyces TaxID=2593676 RepID=UPI0033F7F271